MLVALFLALGVGLGGCTDSTLPAATPKESVASAEPLPVDKVKKAKPVRLTVALTGDFLIHSNVWAAAQTPNGFDFAPLIEPVAQPLRTADLAVCHLETPLAPRGGPFQSYPLFAAPPALLAAVKKAGYDGCTTASNHAVDQGFTGLARTLSLLDEAGLKHSGTQAKPAQSRVAYYEAKGLKIASLSYTYGTNGMPVEHAWSVNMIDPRRMLSDAKQARKNGADVVMVGVHWGSEYQTEPNAQQVQLARTLTKSPNIDVLYGHHAHVVQPVRKINGKWVIFGLGNFLAGQANYMPGVNDGAIARLTLVHRGGRVQLNKPTLIPTRIGADLVVRRR